MILPPFTVQYLPYPTNATTPAAAAAAAPTPTATPTTALAGPFVAAGPFKSFFVTILASATITLLRHYTTPLGNAVGQEGEEAVAVVVARSER